jgi:hypothetical protein
MTQSTKASVLAFLIAPLIPAVAGAVLTPVTSGSGVNIDPASVLGLTMVFAAFSYAAAFVLAIPAFVALQRFGLVNVWSILLAGVLVGAAVSVLMRMPNAVTARDLVVTCSMGLCSAIVFWLVWRTGHGQGAA